MPATLWSIKCSPWSVRVRWALKVSGFEYKTVSYPSVVFQEPRLRFRVRKWRVHVPVIIDNKPILGGMEIVEHVQGQKGAEGPNLVRKGVEKWVGIADDVMENERLRGLEMVLSDKEALKKMEASVIPWPFRWLFKSLFWWLAPPAIRWLFKLGPFGLGLIRGRVWGLSKKDPKKYNEKELTTALAKIQTGVQASSSGYLVGESLSYADIACVTAIETVRGTPGKHVVRFYPPHADLGCPLDDLLAWRDKMHQQHWVDGI